MTEGNWDVSGVDAEFVDAPLGAFGRRRTGRDAGSTASRSASLPFLSFAPPRRRRFAKPSAAT